MKRTFIYKEKFAYSYWTPAVVFIALAVISYFFKRGIAIKSLRLLAYPNSLYVCAGCAVLFIVYALYKYNNAKIAATNPNPIEANDNGITFPKGKNGLVSVAYEDVKDIWHKGENKDASVIIFTKSTRKDYEWDMAGFATADEFREFVDILDKNCSNIQR